MANTITVTAHSTDFVVSDFELPTGEISQVAAAAARYISKQIKVPILHLRKHAIRSLPGGTRVFYCVVLGRIRNGPNGRRGELVDGYVTITLPLNTQR